MDPQLPCTAGRGTQGKRCGKANGERLACGFRDHNSIAIFLCLPQRSHHLFTLQGFKNSNRIMHCSRPMYSPAVCADSFVHLLHSVLQLHTQPMESMVEAQCPVDSWYAEARDDLHLGCNLAYYGWQSSPVKCQMFQLWQLKFQNQRRNEPK